MSTGGESAQGVEDFNMLQSRIETIIADMQSHSKTIAEAVAMLAHEPDQGLQLENLLFRQLMKQDNKS